MPMYFDQEQAQVELDFEKQKLDLIRVEKALEREHAKEMLKLKVDLTAKTKRAVTRIEAAQRVLIATIKLPTLLFVLPFMALMVLCKREVPGFFVEYVSL